MDKIKTVPITDNIRCYVETNGNTIFIYLQERRKHWYGWTWDKIYFTEAYELSLNYNRDTGLRLETMFEGRIGHADLHIRKADEFDLETEIAKLFNRYMDAVKYRKEVDEAIQKAFDKI
jgi:hypothetical protein